MFLGLYSPSDHITILTTANLKEAVFDRSVASFVEFYNSYCGACQRFAPTWKAVALNVSRWNGIVQIGAMDCASDENNDDCRNYEIMRYPTMRYFPPHYAHGPGQRGINLDHLMVPEPDELIDELTKHLVSETHGGPEWPKFDKFEGKNWQQVFEKTSLDTKYVYLVSSNLPGYLAQQVQLDYVGVDGVSVRIIDGENLTLVQVS